MNDQTEYLEPAPLKARVIRLTWMLALGGAVVAGSELVVRPWFRQHFIDAAPVEVVARFRQLLYGLSAVLFAASVWGFWLASRVARHGQWPLPGTFVFKRRAIQRGLKLKLRLVGIIVWAVFTAGVGVYAAILAEHLFGR